MKVTPNDRLSPDAPTSESLLERLELLRDPQVDLLIKTTLEAQRIIQQVKRDEGVMRVLLFGGMPVATP